VAAPGGRRTRHTVIYLSWDEANAFEAVRLADSHRHGRALSRADWLLQVVDPRLRAYAADATLPAHIRQRCAAALTALERERASAAVRAPGRPPQVY
jgi:hypothetical protein